MTKLISNKVTKTETKNVSIANVETSTHLVTKKFIGLNYEKLNAKEQKRFRSAKRTQLFKIIDAKIISLLTKNASFDSKKNFAEFKTFCKDNYSLSLDNVSDVFKGNGHRKESFDKYIELYKANKANVSKANKANVSKAKK